MKWARNSQTHWGHMGMWAQCYQENQSTRFLWEFSQLQILAIQSDLKNHFEGPISRSRGCIQHFERNINSSKPEVYDLEQRGSNLPRGVLQDQRSLMDQKRDGNKNCAQSHHPLLMCCSIHVQAFEKIYMWLQTFCLVFIFNRIGPRCAFQCIAVVSLHLPSAGVIFISLSSSGSSLSPNPLLCHRCPFGSFSGTDCASVSQI